jgi:hypothetical protein
MKIFKGCWHDVTLFIYLLFKIIPAKPFKYFPNKLGKKKILNVVFFPQHFQLHLTQIVVDTALTFI